MAAKQQQQLLLLPAVSLPSLCRRLLQASFRPWALLGHLARLAQQLVHRAAGAAGVHEALAAARRQAGEREAHCRSGGRVCCVYCARSE